MSKDKEEIKIRLDPKNARIHNDENRALINKSLKELGAGRSILIDGEDYVIAGNGVYQEAEANGIKIKIIETDGTELIAIKRTDLKYNDKKRKELAIVDNAATDKSSFNEEIFEDEYFQEVDIEEWGGVNNTKMLSDEEIAAFFKRDDSEQQEQKQRIVLEYTIDEYEMVKEALTAHGKTPEQAVWKLLQL